MRGVVASSRFPDFPDVPTLAQLGYKQNLVGVWFAFFAPAGVPNEVSSALVLAIEKAVKAPAITAKLASLGMVQDYEAPDRLVSEMREEHRAVEEIAKKAGLIK
jgi:tripartite-type tricarboxylate transporter receptor subunit TctC